MSDSLYEDAVRAAKEHVTAGDIFQVVLSQRFDLDSLGVDPFDVYRVLRLVNPSPYLYFLRFPEVTVVGASPEPMVRLREGTVVSRPIAGSRRRGATPEDDARLEAELVEDPKEQAEHVMLVDLARNDVGRVVSFGTEVVEEMMVVERYSHIMHLTSQVTGRLSPGKGPSTYCGPHFPAGTLSGAPKVRAMQIIDELEPTKRGVYGGVVGYLDFSGNLDTAIAIRTMTVASRRSASVQAGAGIVADSDPAAENAECGDKAAAMLSAVAMARAAGAAAGARMSGAEARRLVRRGGYAALRRRPASTSCPGTCCRCRARMPPPTSRVSAARTWPPSAARHAEALLLSPQGKVDAYVRVTRTADDAFVIDTDAGFGAVVQARLERFRLRIKVAIEPLDWICVAVRGPDAAPGVAGGPELTLRGRLAGLVRGRPARAGPVRRAVGVGRRSGGPVRREAWEAARIEAGHSGQRS